MLKVIFGDARSMVEVPDQSVHLMITSPPYWQLKDYGCPDQIGYHDTYPDYIENLNRVWDETYRVLHDACTPAEGRLPGSYRQSGGSNGAVRTLQP